MFTIKKREQGHVSHYFLLKILIHFLLINLSFNVSVVIDQPFSEKCQITNPNILNLDNERRRASLHIWEACIIKYFFAYFLKLKHKKLNLIMNSIVCTLTHRLSVSAIKSSGKFHPDRHSVHLDHRLQISYSITDSTLSTQQEYYMVYYTKYRVYITFISVRVNKNKSPPCVQPPLRRRVHLC